MCFAYESLLRKLDQKSVGKTRDVEIIGKALEGHRLERGSAKYPGTVVDHVCMQVNPVAAGEIYH